MPNAASVAIKRNLDNLNFDITNLGVVVDNLSSQNAQRLPTGTASIIQTLGDRLKKEDHISQTITDCFRILEKLLAISQNINQTSFMGFKHVIKERDRDELQETNERYQNNILEFLELLKGDHPALFYKAKYSQDEEILDLLGEEDQYDRDRHSLVALEYESKRLNDQIASIQTADLTTQGPLLHKLNRAGIGSLGWLEGIKAGYTSSKRAHSAMLDTNYDLLKPTIDFYENELKLSLEWLQKVNLGIFLIERYDLGDRLQAYPLPKDEFGKQLDKLTMAKQKFASKSQEAATLITEKENNRLDLKADRNDIIARIKSGFRAFENAKKIEKYIHGKDEKKYVRDKNDPRENRRQYCFSNQERPTLDAGPSRVPI
jgi:hypothetical protein